MVKSFCDEFEIDREVLKKSGALDIVLNIDTPYFIDPALLRITNIPEFIGASSEIEKYFNQIVVLVKNTSSEKDMYWKRADDLLNFKEIKGTCLGYSNNSTSGNAIGKELRKKIIETIKELLKSGTIDPLIFELLGVFQEKIGCDRISDLVTFIIKDEIENYTKEVLSKLGITCVNERGFVVNPYNGEEILLLPMEILTPLPVAESFEDIDFCCSENRRVRDAINQYIDMGSRNKLKKEEIYSLMVSNPEFRDLLTELYRNTNPNVYDFRSDPVGLQIWHSESQKIVREFPQDLKKPRNNKELLQLVVCICNKFKMLVENNGLWHMLYDDKDKAKHESAAQLLYFGIADSYCAANDIDISREVNNGQGPADFKLSAGYNKKIVVEVKLTSNTQLLHGIAKQLPIYMKQENTDKAVYLIIDNSDHKGLERFQEYYNKLSKSEKSKIPYILIDGNRQASASKA